MAEGDPAVDPVTDPNKGKIEATDDPVVAPSADADADADADANPDAGADDANSSPIAPMLHKDFYLEHPTLGNIESLHPDLSARSGEDVEKYRAQNGIVVHSVRGRHAPK